MTMLMMIGALAIILLGMLVFGLLQSHAEILRRLHDLDSGLHGGQPSPAGHRAVTLTTKPGVALPRPDAPPAHDIIGTTSQGGARRVGVVGASHPTLLAFLSTGCLSCKGFWDAFSDPELALPGIDTRLVIVTKGLDNESPSAIRKLAPGHVTTVASSSAWTDYEVTMSPYFILVDGPSGTTLGEGSAATWAQIDDLLGQAMLDLGADPGRAVAASASPRRPKGDRGRGERADAELAAAGIHRGHDSLYPGRSG